MAKTIQTRPTVALDRSAQAAVRNLRKLKAERDELNLKIKAAENKIKAAMGDHEEATVGGRPVATWVHYYRDQINPTKLKENFPAAAEACTIQVSVRTFKLLEEL